MTVLNLKWMEHEYALCLAYFSKPTSASLFGQKAEGKYSWTF
jgi:hypothetical protein